MVVKQLSVFIENKSGRLVQITEILGKNQIDIRAVSIADTTSFGILRLIVDDPKSSPSPLKMSQADFPRRFGFFPTLKSAWSICMPF